MVEAFGILCLLAVFGWLVYESLRADLERATQVGVDGLSPLGLGLAKPGQGMTATVDADTSLETP